MDEQGFWKALKRAGKKEHVVYSLVAGVRAFDAYLVDQGLPGVETAGEEEIRSYVEGLDAGQVKERLRGLALYFRYVENEPLARLAASLREQRLEKTRHAFKLREFRGADPEAIARLEAVGIVTAEEMLAAGCKPEDRQALAGRAGVAPETVLELVKLSDLSRIGSVKSVRARLYCEAGLDSPSKLAGWEPEALCQMLKEFVARTGFDGIPPLPKEVHNTIAAARRLPEVVAY